MLSQLGADGTFHLPQLISSNRLVDDSDRCNSASKVEKSLVSSGFLSVAPLIRNLAPVARFPEGIIELYR